MRALRTSHYKDYSINSCYRQSETSLPVRNYNWDVCSSRCSQTERRSREYHTAFMVGHFDFQHPYLFLLINQLHHKVLTISGLIVGSQQLPYTLALQCDCRLRLRSVTTSYNDTDMTLFLLFKLLTALAMIQEIFEQHISCANITEIKLQVFLWYSTINGLTVAVDW